MTTQWVPLRGIHLLWGRYQYPQVSGSTEIQVSPGALGNLGTCPKYPLLGHRDGHKHSACCYPIRHDLPVLFLKFLAVPGLCCCMQALSSCGELGPLSSCVHQLLTTTASLVSEYRLQAPGLQ